VSFNHFTSLQLRVMSAGILAPIAVGTLYLGGLYFLVFLGLASLAMCFEWCKNSLSGRLPIFMVLMAVTVLTALYFSFYSQLYQSVIVIICGALLAMLIGSFLSQSKDLVWLLLGPLCIGLPIISVEYIRNIPGDGFELAISLFFVIWATDIGAYFSGKTIGGPKILPSISPNKTWAGLIGGMVAAAVTAFCMANFLTIVEVSPFSALMVGAISAILAQIGDFAESAWKRNFGIKDASNLIPGHGGVLDRLDGILFVAPGFLFLLIFATGY
jgi:phosphatidate cytidylyltransferase